MCRLFGMAAPSRTPIRWALRSAENSLERQSTRHPDGWGLATYDGDAAVIRKGADPAFADGSFRTALDGVDGSPVVAHVRRATVGPRVRRNNHPFRYGPWVMAHNGTLSEVEAVREAVHDFLPADLEENIQGETDSELFFHLVLAYLRKAEGTIDADVGAAAQAVEEAVDHVRRLDDRHDVDEPSEMNVLLTDGDGFVATRYGHSLYVLDRRGEDPANHTAEGPNLAGAVAFSSERVSRLDEWSEVEPRSLVTVRPDEPLERVPLKARAVA